MKIFYAGHKQTKEYRGLLFLRLQLVDVPADVARGLLTAQPRVFFAQGERVPRETLAQQFTVFDRIIEEAENRQEQYYAQAAQYTDPKDKPKKEGAMDEVRYARDLIRATQEAKEAALALFGGDIDAAIDADVEQIAAINEGTAVAAGGADKQMLQSALQQIEDLKTQLAQAADLKAQLAQMAAIAQQLDSLKKLADDQAKELAALKKKQPASDDK